MVEGGGGSRKTRLSVCGFLFVWSAAKESEKEEGHVLSYLTMEESKLLRKLLTMNLEGLLGGHLHIGSSSPVKPLGQFVQDFDGPMYRGLSFPCFSKRRSTLCELLQVVMTFVDLHFRSFKVLPSNGAAIDTGMITVILYENSTNGKMFYPSFFEIYDTSSLEYLLGFCNDCQNLDGEMNVMIRDDRDWRRHVERAILFEY
ncbi:hypothetical protein Tco_1204736 [Tanacetum coccineum]